MLPLGVSVVLPKIRPLQTKQHRNDLEQTGINRTASPWPALYVRYHMKIIGAFKATQFALTFAFAVSIFATAQFVSISEAQANPARLAAIKRVEGLHERKNRKAIQAMVGVNPVSTPWCGAAAAYAVKKAGGRPPAGHNKAISWTKFGKGVSLASAQKGDIVVLRFKRGYHVGVYSRKVDGGRIEVCGGNTSNSFKCTAYRASNVKAVRR